MKKYIIILFAFIGSLVNAQDYEQLCLDCAEQNGFYCGDDPANWTQYSPDGCVPNGFNNLFYLNMILLCTIYVYFKPQVQSTIKYILYISRKVQFWEGIKKVQIFGEM